MIPIRDNIQTRRIPWVNYAIIATCTAVFLLQLVAGQDGDAEIIERWGMIPARVIAPVGERIVIESPQMVQTPFGKAVRSVLHELPQAPISDWLTLVTCMFLHGGFWHCLGNLWFLHVFGDNVEDRLGHAMYAIVYLGCGLVAGFTHLAMNLHSSIPTIGASGAIAGIMGAYLMLYPRAKVLAVIPLVILFPTIIVPAPLFLGFWFFMQFYNGASAALDSASGGVAWWAHVGGFVAGIAVAYGLTIVQSPDDENHEYLPSADLNGLSDRRR